MISSLYRKPCGNKAMGMEIECMVSEDDMPGDRPEFYKFWRVGSDGSICVGRLNHRAIEFASQPLTHEWLIKEINKLWDKYPWVTNASCGIHIHVSRKWLSEKRAKAIHKWYCSLSDADQEEIFGRSSNSYCRKWEWNTTRYNAVNADNTKTFEFRMFASGPADWAIYCAHLAKWMVEHHAHLNVDAALALKALHWG